jgi:WD40 repeat protein
MTWPIRVLVIVGIASGTLGVQRCFAADPLFEIVPPIGHIAKIEDIAISPDGSLMASSAGGNDTSVRLWSVPKGRLIRSFKASNTFTAPNPIKFSPDGRFLVGVNLAANVNGKREIGIWDVKTSKLL